MRRLVTLISPPGRLPASLVRDAARLLDAGDVADWLSPATAVDLPLSGTSETAMTELRRLCAEAGVDLALQPQAHRRKRLLVADMDSTMIEQECLDELAAEFGLKDRIAAITERAMRGEITFEPALRERVGLLQGRPASAIDSVHARITLTAGGDTLIATMRRAGAHTALVSGGFTVFTGPIADRLGFHEHHGNTILAVEGLLTGEVQEPILGREAKVQTLRALRERLGLSPEETMAVGDGANDLAMLAEAGTGVAFHAKPAVAEAAHVRIDHADLTALLYLQGYRESEFVRV